MTHLTPTDKIILKDYQGSPIVLFVAVIFGLAALIVVSVYAFYLILNLLIS